MLPEGSEAKIRRIDRCPNIPRKLSPPLHDTANTWRRRDVNNGDVNSPCTIKLHSHWQNRVDASHREYVNYPFDCRSSVNFNFETENRLPQLVDEIRMNQWPI